VALRIVFHNIDKYNIVSVIPERPRVAVGENLPCRRYRVAIVGKTTGISDTNAINLSSIWMIPESPCTVRRSTRRNVFSLLPKHPPQLPRDGFVDLLVSHQTAQLGRQSLWLTNLKPKMRMQCPLNLKNGLKFRVDLISGFKASNRRLRRSNLISQLFLG
jgi:hypothetical protein